MTSDSIIKAIAEYLGLSIEDLDRSSLLREDLGLGPIEINDLCHYLAEIYDITFEPEDLKNLKSVDDLIVLIEDNLIQ